ncbi:MAG TPA: hypothetical protein ENJ82_10380 [Bacteroidetes bacterium]|nr:hypothetical protein [Bacteroidota bacterium]
MINSSKIHQRQRQDHTSSQSNFLESQGMESAQPPELQLEASEAGKEQPKSKKKDIKVTIAADKESEFLSPEYRAGEVGHAWIKIDKPGELQDSYGFWPANLGAGGGFNPRKPHKSVAGEVKNPDTMHTPTQETSEMTDEETLAKGIKYAGKHKSHKYNLITYNCTTFASRMFKKATGKSAPTSGILGLGMNPNYLNYSIKKKNEKGAKKSKEE